MLGSDRYIESKKAKTGTVTFRLPLSLIEELRMDAELEGISLNSFAAKIFSNHIHWERYERKVGLLPMTEAFLKEVLNQLDDEQVINLAQKIEKQKFKNILAFMKDSHNVVEFVEVMRTWLTVSWMQQSIEIRDGTYHFRIQHSLGSKWSLYVQTLISELYEDILGKKADITMVEDTISFVFSWD
jgi:HicB-like protein involved in pilus formation